MLTLMIAVLAFVAIAGIGMALSGGDGDAARKRARAIGAGTTVAGKGRAGKALDESAKRRAKTQEMLESLRKQGEARRKNSSAQTIKAKLVQAGLDVPDVCVLGVFHSSGRGLRCARFTCPGLMV